MNNLLDQAYGRIGMFTSFMVYIRSMVRQAVHISQSGFQVSLATYRAAMAIQQSLATPLERYSLIQEPVILEDALGRIAPVHLQLITSWKAFDTVLKIRFETLQGYSKVKRREFVLQERATAREVSRVVPWERALRPGQMIEMSLVFQESITVEEDSPTQTDGAIGMDLNLCPNCQASPSGTETLDISWYVFHNNLNRCSLR